MGRPPSPREAMLAAAAGLFAHASAPAAVTMDAIAAAAGVGKGTLFRAFGDRDGLLDALAARKFAPVRAAAEHGDAGNEAAIPAPGRAVAFLDAILTFKLDNRNLMRAREAAGTGDLRSERYRWMHDHLARLIRDAMPQATAEETSYTAHTMLSALRIDLIEELLATGHSTENIRRAQAAQTRSILTSAIQD
jgi:AcrR family transcriptional regulator